MLSSSEIKFLRSLHLKKFRQKYRAFIAEGTLNVLESLKSSYKIKAIYGTKQFFDANREEIKLFSGVFKETSEKDLSRSGALASNNAALAVLEIPERFSDCLPEPSGNLILVMDGINEPGNLGAIIRIADWYGIDHLICSEDSVDVYHPKVIHASMGSWSRVKTYYAGLAGYLEKNKNKTVIYGAALHGKNIHTEKLNGKGILVVGNEAHGISQRLIKFVTAPITIPRFGKAESLNVAVAVGIICDHFRHCNNIAINH